MNTTLITSAQNPIIKHFVLLQQKAAARRQEALTVVEGKRELQHCVNAGYIIDTLLFCPNITGNEQDSIFNCAKRVFEVSRDVYAKLAYRESTEGFIASIKVPTLSLGDLKLSHNPLIIVIEGVEKPGNIGAILRSADAAHADAVLVCNPKCDIYNPNLIRASLGAVFTVPVVACSSQECISFLKNKNIKILTAQLQDSSLYYNTDMTSPVAIVMGTEDKGLSNEWRIAADAHIRIPMQGALDSLNVSVSTAILLFEAVRQRLS